MSILVQWLAQGLDHLLPLTQTHQNIGARMSQTETALAELDEATNAVAERIETLANRVEEFDTATAASIRAEAVQLRGLAADPQNPVPDGDQSAPVDPNA